MDNIRPDAVPLAALAKHVVVILFLYLRKIFISRGVGWIVDILDLVDLRLESRIIENPLDRFGDFGGATIVDVKQL